MRHSYRLHKLCPHKALRFEMWWACEVWQSWTSWGRRQPVRVLLWFAFIDWSIGWLIQVSPRLDRDSLKRLWPVTISSDRLTECSDRLHECSDWSTANFDQLITWAPKSDVTTTTTDRHQIQRHNWAKLSHRVSQTEPSRSQIEPSSEPNWAIEWAKSSHRAAKLSHRDPDPRDWMRDFDQRVVRMCVCVHVWHRCVSDQAQVYCIGTFTAERARDLRSAGRTAWLAAAANRAWIQKTPPDYSPTPQGPNPIANYHRNNISVTFQKNYVYTVVIRMITQITNKHLKSRF